MNQKGKIILLQNLALILSQRNHYKTQPGDLLRRDPNKAIKVTQVT